MKLFVTGGTGFLGSHFLRVALEAGHEITALRRNEDSKPRLELARPVEWLHKGLDEVTANDLVAHDVLVHLAASGVKAASRAWPEALETNVLGSVRLFGEARRCPGGPPAFFMARTFYEDLVDREPQLKENPYIATKRAASEIVRSLAGDFGAPVVLLRVFQVYGPLDDPKNVLSYAAGQFARGERALFGSGKSRRDWIRVGDAANCLLDAVASVPSMTPGTTFDFDLGSGQLHSIREMVEQLARIAGLNPEAVCDFDSARDRADSGVELAASKPLCGGVEPAAPEVGLSELWQSALHQVRQS